MCRTEADTQDVAATLVAVYSLQRVSLLHVRELDPARLMLLSSRLKQTHGSWRLPMKTQTREQQVPHESEQTLPSTGPAAGRKAGTAQPGIADADKQARTGSTDEAVRSTPPAGSWNDVAPNE